MYTAPDRYTTVLPFVANRREAIAEVRSIANEMIERMARADRLPAFGTSPWAFDRNTSLRRLATEAFAIARAH